MIENPVIITLLKNAVIIMPSLALITSRIFSIKCDELGQSIFNKEDSFVFLKALITTK
jgi:hypothetical protein